MNKLIISIAATVFALSFSGGASAQQTDAYTCIDRHPNGVAVWGCYNGEPYWNIAEYAGDAPMISGGTLYTPSQRKRSPGMGGRIIDNAFHDLSWRTEAEINRKVEKGINKAMDKLF